MNKTTQKIQTTYVLTWTLQVYYFQVTEKDSIVNCLCYKLYSVVSVALIVMIYLLQDFLLFCPQLFKLLSWPSLRGK